MEMPAGRHQVREIRDQEGNPGASTRGKRCARTCTELPVLATGEPDGIVIGRAVPSLHLAAEGGLFLRTDEFRRPLTRIGGVGWHGTPAGWPRG